MSDDTKEQTTSESAAVTRTLTAEDITKLGHGPWAPARRPYRSHKPIDAGEIVSVQGIRDPRGFRDQGFIGDSIALADLLRSGAACECGTPFLSPLHARAHWKLRHSDDAVRRDEVEKKRQADRDEADRRGAEESRRLYAAESHSCWACAQAVRPGQFVEPMPEGYQSKRPKVVHREVAAVGPDSPRPAA